MRSQQTSGYNLDMRRCLDRRVRTMTDPTLPRIGATVAIGNGHQGRVRSIDKVNRVVRIYFGTYDGKPVTRDYHVNDLALVS